MGRPRQILVFVCLHSFLPECPAVRRLERQPVEKLMNQGTPFPHICYYEGEDYTCVDQVTRETMPELCCSRWLDCLKFRGNDAEDYGERVAIYTTNCGVLQSDVARKDGRPVVGDTGRICSATCLGLPQLSESLEPLRSEVSTFCPRSETEALTATVQLVEALDAARLGCGKENPSSEGPKTQPVQTLQQPQCPDRGMVAHDCGKVGTTQAQCEASGCCWDPVAASRKGRPWCYKKAGSVQCQWKCPDQKFPPQFREDCAPFLLLDQFVNPSDEVRGDACRSVGCCWQPLQHGSKEPWCFHTPCI